MSQRASVSMPAEQLNELLLFVLYIRSFLKNINGVYCYYYVTTLRKVPIPCHYIQWYSNGGSFLLYCRVMTVCVTPAGRESSANMK